MDLGVPVNLLFKGGHVLDRSPASDVPILILPEDTIQEPCGTIAFRSMLPPYVSLAAILDIAKSDLP